MTGITKLSTALGPNWHGIYVSRKTLNHQFNPFYGKIPQIYKVDAHALSRIETTTWMETTYTTCKKEAKRYL